MDIRLSHQSITASCGGWCYIMCYPGPFWSSSRICSGATLISDLYWSGYQYHYPRAPSWTYLQMTYSSTRLFPDWKTMLQPKMISMLLQTGQMITTLCWTLLSVSLWPYLRKKSYSALLLNYHWTAILWIKLTLSSIWGFCLVVTCHGHLILPQYALKHIRWLGIFTENSIQWQMQTPLPIFTPPWFDRTLNMLAQYGHHTPTKILIFLRVCKGLPVRWPRIVGVQATKISWH